MSVHFHYLLSICCQSCVIIGEEVILSAVYLHLGSLSSIVMAIAGIPGTLWHHLWLAGVDCLYLQY